MKKMKLSTFLVGLLSFGFIAGGAVAVNASSGSSDRPAWVTADGRTDLKNMPDNAEVPYQCWSGKTITLSGKTVKQRETRNVLPGSAEHELGMAKVNELRQIPGVITTDDKNGEVINIDDNNPEIQKIMKKYEIKENPQCQ